MAAPIARDILEHVLKLDTGGLVMSVFQFLIDCVVIAYINLGLVFIGAPPI